MPEEKAMEMAEVADLVPSGHFGEIA